MDVQGGGAMLTAFVILAVVVVLAALVCFGLGLCRAASDADDARGTR